MPNGASYSDGAALLSDASALTMGSVGRYAYGLTVLLACMTTAVGLLAASAEFFNRLIPKLSYRALLIVFAVIGFAFASYGLETLLKISAPLITFLYPIAIAWCLRLCSAMLCVCAVISCSLSLRGAQPCGRRLPLSRAC